jgi:hypothetical protein
MSEFEKSFDLNQLSLSENPQGFQQISQRYGNYSLIHSSAVFYDVPTDVLEIQRNGRTTAKAIRMSSDGNRLSVSGFTEDGTILAGAEHGFLSAYNLKDHQDLESQGPRSLL